MQFQSLLFYWDLNEVHGSYVWILKWVNLHWNWINLISALNFPKQWVADYSEVGQTSKIECFMKKKKIIFTKHSILDIWHGSEYTWIS